MEREEERKEEKKKRKKKREKINKVCFCISVVLTIFCKEIL